MNWIDYADGCRIAKAAQSCIGVPFRFQGRDPRLGLDCLGLAIHAVQHVRPVLPPPCNYRLRGPSQSVIEQWAVAAGLGRMDQDIARQPGDILLLRPAPGQSHIMLVAETGFVHSHIGCRKVVHTDRLPQWPIVRTWRLLRLKAD